MYERQFDVELPGIGRVDIDKVMATVAGVAAVGVGADMMLSRAAGRWKENGQKPEQKQEGKES
jgi:hypothetical protein